MLKNEAIFVTEDEKKKIYLDVSVTICRTTFSLLTSNNALEMKCDKRKN